MMVAFVSRLVGRAVTLTRRPLQLLVDRHLGGVSSSRAMTNVIGGGEGKGGGGGGAVRSAGGALGKKSHTSEEEYFREKQHQEIKALNRQLDTMRRGKIEYHEKQLRRHLDQIKQHEEIMKKDKDVTHKVYIESHREASDAHREYIKNLRSQLSGNKK